MKRAVSYHCVSRGKLHATRKRSAVRRAIGKLYAHRDGQDRRRCCDGWAVETPSATMGGSTRRARAVVLFACAANDAREMRRDRGRVKRGKERNKGHRNEVAQRSQRLSHSAHVSAGNNERRRMSHCRLQARSKDPMRTTAEEGKGINAR